MLIRVAVLIALLVGSSLYAQPTKGLQYHDVYQFQGLDQKSPGHVAQPGSFISGKNFDTDAEGGLQRSKGSTRISTLTGFGAISNPTFLGDIDPSMADSPRLLILAADATSPTTGQSGHHIFACDLTDDGDSSGVVLGGSISWHQVDAPVELSVDIGYLDGIYDHAYSNGLVYLSTEDGVIEVGGEQGSSSYSNPVTSAWLGSPARPTAVTSGGSNLTGTYQHKITFVSPLGESMPSKPSVPVSTASGSLAVTIATGGEGTTARRIYRTRGQITIPNASLEDWTGGSADSWTLTGTGATELETGDVSDLIAGFGPTEVTSWHAMPGGYEFSPLSLGNNATEGAYSMGVVPGYLEDAGYLIPDHYGFSNYTAGDISPYDKLSVDIYIHPDEVHMIHSVGVTVRETGAGGATAADGTHYSIAGWTTVDLTKGTTAAFDSMTIWILGNTPIAGYYTASESVVFDNLRGISTNTSLGTTAATIISGAGASAIMTVAVDLTDYQGESVTLHGNAKAEAASKVRLLFYDDGATTTYYSDYNTTSAAFEELTTAATVHASAGSGSYIGFEVVAGTNKVIADEFALTLGGQGALGDYFYVATVSDNTTTLYHDDIAESSMGSAADWTSSGFVPAGQWLEYHMERLWSIGDTQISTQRQILWYSDDGDMEAWPEANYIIVGYNDGDPATGLVSFQQNLYILKRNSIWRLSGADSTDFALRKVVENVGCEDGRTVAVSDGAVYFFGKRSIYAFDGFRANDLGRFLEGGYVDDVYIDSTTSRFQATALFARNRYILAYKTSSSATFAQALLLWNAQTNRWSRHSQTHYPTVWCFPRTRSSSMLACANDGEIWKQYEYGHDQHGYMNPQLDVSLPVIPLGSYAIDKRVDKIIFSYEGFYDASGTVYQFDLYKDATTRQIMDGSVSASTSTTAGLSLGHNTFEWPLRTTDNIYRTLSLRIREYGLATDSSDEGKEPPKMLGYSIEYRPLRRIP